MLVKNEMITKFIFKTFDILISFILSAQRRLQRARPLFGRDPLKAMVLRSLFNNLVQIESERKGFP